MSKIEEAIRAYLEKKKSPATFGELYEAMPDASQQGIRNRVYKMMAKGLIDEIKKKPNTDNRHKGLGTKVEFKLKSK